MILFILFFFIFSCISFFFLPNLIEFPIVFPHIFIYCASLFVPFSVPIILLIMLFFSFLLWDFIHILLPSIVSFIVILFREDFLDSTIFRFFFLMCYFAILVIFAGSVSVAGVLINIFVLMFAYWFCSKFKDD